ncbi:amidase [Ornithinimicrobium cerasi]|uniref:Aspartyl-tRNA(Asn)/glutamyl-tRNA(Gln) amidotransferase subunit A n=1 Tax=Ornithinimicrobium cerasi TaxID=2248773 RepID=A0A285W0D2_9MICO|nr:amidase [Ornithinimicrobium cerasi]SOC58391.1 aspartyl-tRNA(Asn)/glutamyl-tRNA(Gln) amidotransferase subunit A [Ornithinimicrobium cerasi]
MDLADLGAAVLADAYARGELSPVDVAEAVSRRIDDEEPRLNAFWSRDDPEDVHRAAHASAERWAGGRPLSVLDGMPVTLKENIARAGIPMPAGCAGVTPVVPAQDAPVTRRVLGAGMLVIGSTVMPDWGMLSSGHSSLHGQTFSPLDPSWSTGGSSSGAGAAAAAGYGPLHVGTDIGGSIRLPGTWLGLATLKPSAGRIPLQAPYLGRVAGPMARSAADCALLMRVLAGPDPVDWTSLPAQEIDWGTDALDPVGLRVGLWTSPGYGMPPEPETVAAVRRVADAIADAGAQVVEVGPWLEQEQLDGVDRFWRARSLADLARLSPDAQARVLPYVAEWARGAEGLSGTDVMDGYAAFAQVQARTVEAWARAGDPDLLLSPVAPCAAPPAQLPMPYPDEGRGMWHINFTMPWNMTGQPAGTVAAGAMPDGRPVGVQVVGRPFDDAGVLRTMAWWERARAA